MGPHRPVLHGRAGVLRGPRLDLWARYLRVYSARTELDRGRWAAAARAIPPTVERPGTVLARIGALVVLGLLRARRGDPGPWVLLDEAAELAERSGELQWTAPVCAARAEAAWLGGRGDVETDSAAVLQACVDGRAGWWAGEIAWWRRCAGIDEPVPPMPPSPGRSCSAGAAPAAAAAWRRVGCPYEEALALAESDDRTTSVGRSPASTRSGPARPRRPSLGACASRRTRECRVACGRPRAPTRPA